MRDWAARANMRSGRTSKCALKYAQGCEHLRMRSSIGQLLRIIYSANRLLRTDATPNKPAAGSRPAWPSQSPAACTPLELLGRRQQPALFSLDPHALARA
jgi:hypothetical protein